LATWSERGPNTRNTPTLAGIGLGGNEGVPEQTLPAATERIRSIPQTSWVAGSPTYWTPPWGVSSPQPAYLNGVVLVNTDLSAAELLMALQVIEHDFGRTRGSERYGARTLDLDVLFYGQAIIDEADLVVPHPRLHERGFVLLPLNDIAPELEIPGLDRVDHLLEALDPDALDGIRAAGVELVAKT
jgi:2-amino-4-hydroxy-6-hydroxymethyldihydropteridine diphosphokinase